jgi:PAS domain S-box-containing protein
VEVTGSVVRRADDGRPLAVAGTMRDVTERHRERLALERAREHSEKLLRETGELAGVGGWSFEVASQSLEWTHMTRKIHQVADDFVPTVAEAVAFYAPESRPTIAAAVELALRDGTPFDVELRLVTAASRSIWVRAVGRAELRDGTVARLVGAFQDVSEQRSRATALRDEWSKTQRYLDTVQTVIVALDAQLTVTMSNRHACDLLGYAREDLIGRSWLDVCISPGHRDRHAEIVRAALAGTEARDRELPVRCRDGRERVVSWRATRMVDAVTGASGVLLSGEDVTGQRELEQRMTRAQRLEAIGTLAGGLAHDLNNALTPITLALDVLGESRPADDGLISVLARSAGHAAAVVRQLLTFARGARGEKTQLDPQTSVREIAELLGSLLPKSITLELGVRPGLPHVLADPTQLQQVLLNLCVNARDAMPQGGKLGLEVSSTVLESAPNETHWGAPCVPGPYVVFRVTDTGMGIPADVLERIVEPFFTTKALEGGSGLGLSMVVGITKAHGGFLSVSTTLGRGSTFAIFFPVFSEGLSPALSPTRDAAHGAPTPGREDEAVGLRKLLGPSVLFVDDEVAVGQVASRILEVARCRVEVFASGEAALAHFAVDPARWDVLVTDYHMPDMNGARLAEAARRLRPSIAIVIASGRFEDYRAQDVTLPDRCVRLDKPFGPDRLMAAIKAAIARVADGQSPSEKPERS